MPRPWFCVLAIAVPCDLGIFFSMWTSQVRSFEESYRTASNGAKKKIWFKFWNAPTAVFYLNLDRSLFFYQLRNKHEDFILGFKEVLHTYKHESLLSIWNIDHGARTSTPKLATGALPWRAIMQAICQLPSRKVDGPHRWHNWWYIACSLVIIVSTASRDIFLLGGQCVFQPQVIIVNHGEAHTEIRQPQLTYNATLAVRC